VKGRKFKEAGRLSNEIKQRQAAMESFAADLSRLRAEADDAEATARQRQSDVDRARGALLSAEEQADREEVDDLKRQVGSLQKVSVAMRRAARSKRSQGKTGGSAADAATEDAADSAATDAERAWELFKAGREYDLAA